VLAELGLIIDRTVQLEFNRSSQQQCAPIS
jgi:hypothetical protein